jgi:mRNA-degrading endonuclease RelE of RelBE toxin-antitoxin system
LTRYKVLLSETARRQLREVPQTTRHRIKAALGELEEDPFRPRAKADIKKLRGIDRVYYRQRIGDHRAIYVVDGHRVLVAKILPRSKAYSWLD